MLDVREQVPLAPLTTFGIGGPARYFVDVTSEKEIMQALHWATRKNVRAVLLAGGSNVLVPDEGLEALVIRIAQSAYDISGATLIADAGCNLCELIGKTAAAGLGGWERLAGIPGTIGGAVRGNAGAFGTEMRDIVVWVRAVDMESGEVREYTNEECHFSYRMSYFKRNPALFVTKVCVALEEVPPVEAQRIIEETVAERERRHIQDVRAAGSYFMNPVAPKAIQSRFEKEKGVAARGGRVPAGWLIEKAGLKGARVGGAQASEQHPNYLVNTGTATAADVRALAERIREAVQDAFGVELQEEAVVLGRDGRTVR